ncbi:hypothetical protein Tco_1329187 [Tanacetum coccineum]
MGNAIVKLVKKVKKLEGFLKRRNLVLSDSEVEEPEAQGRKSQESQMITIDYSANTGWLILYNNKLKDSGRKSGRLKNGDTEKKRLKEDSNGSTKDITGSETMKELLRVKRTNSSREVSLALKANLVGTLQKEEVAKHATFGSLLSTKDCRDDDLKMSKQIKRKFKFSLSSAFH